MIPKIIHYCWFGGKRKPKLIRDCIKSWKIYLPDYEFFEWNETNCDLSIPFVEEAYKQKKWAFVSDYVRLQKLNEYGGIYMDTDMMVIKPFDSLLTNECFFGAEDIEFISAGIIGAAKKNEFIKECFNIYKTIKINQETDWGQITIPRNITKFFRKKYSYFLPFDKEINIDRVVIYPIDYFYPISYENKKNINNYRSHLSESSFAVHLWNSSWIEYNEFHYFRNGNYLKGIKKSLNNCLKKRTLKVAYLRKIASCIKESLIKKN